MMSMRAPILAALVILSLILHGETSHWQTEIGILKLESKDDEQAQVKYYLLQAEKFKDSDIKLAIDYAEKALSEATIINSGKLIGESKLTLGTCYNILGIDKESIAYLNDALATFIKLNEKKKTAETLFIIGNIYYYSSVYEMAMKNYRQVSFLGQELGDTLLSIEGAIGQGSVYGNINKYDSAMILFNESFLLAREIGDQATEVQSLLYIGDVYLFSGRPQPALEKYAEVENRYDLRKVNPKLVITLYNSFTLAFINTGDLKNAKLYSSKSMEALGSNPRKVHLSDYYLNRFRIDSAEKNYASALKNYINFKEYSDSVNNSELRKTLANFNILYELKQKEGEVTRLKNENTLKDFKIRQKRIENFGGVTLVLLLFVILYQMLRNNRKIREKNLVLQSQGEELEAILANLRNIQDQLIQSEKMAAIGVLASGVSHEINNPLNYILGSVQYIKEHCKEPRSGVGSETDFYIEAISIGAEKISSIVAGLNRFSRKGESYQMAANLHEIADTCFLMLNHLTFDRIEIKKEYSEIPCIIYCDASKLHQCLLSLLLNAVQSIESAGIITFRTGIVGKKIKVTIEDNGCGISSDILPRIFDPFFTTKDPGEGVGLGLSITYKIIREFNGTIDIKSDIGKGTTVIVTFPQYNESGSVSK
jgi:signal transduction histidine kinase